MATTIQVQDDTKELLRHFIKLTNSKTYDEAIQRIIRMKSKGSLFGAFASGKKYSAKGIVKHLREERDNAGRF